MVDYAEFSIIPILGRRTDVPQGDPSLFQYLSNNVAMTNDVGGINFDTTRRRNTCSKSYGSIAWSASATSQATKCQGLYELYDGTNRNYIIVDNGKIYTFTNLAPIDRSGSVTFGQANTDLASFAQIGNYVIFADHGNTTPYRWTHGDSATSKAIRSGTEYKFRYLVVFQRRLIGLYSDQTNGNIDIRWSTDWPTTAMSALYFPSANQLYIPNDDPIVGGATMGLDRCYIYSENSIQQLVYYVNYETPFQCYTVVPNQGAVNHQSIVNIGNIHLFFNSNMGFCGYDGGREIYSICKDIDHDISKIDTTYHNLIVGTYIPMTNQVVWTVPAEGSATPNMLFWYDLDTKHWRIEDKAMRFVDSWKIQTSYSWNNLISEAGGSGAVWEPIQNQTWGNYISKKRRLVYANTDGYVYYHYGDVLPSTSELNGYRIEPILDFGDRYRMDLLSEIWFNFDRVGDFSVDVYHRSGNTIGEVEIADWTSLGSISCDSPSEPVLSVDQNAKLHQIKWGTDEDSEPFEVSRILFRYKPGGKW